MQIPLRGELTQATSLSLPAPNNPELAIKSHDTFGNLLNHITRLSAFHSAVTSVQIAQPTNDDSQKPVQSNPASALTQLGSTVAVSKSARETTSSWGNTASETAVAEAALYPFLIHLAVAKDDVDSLRFCLGIPPPSEDQGASPSAYGNIPISSINRSLVQGGMENCLDAASGRTPLHVAGVNGSVKCTKVLLEAGALVHIRDSLDHTPLYYVRFLSLSGRSPL
jgi:60kDa lysophospholipase